MLSAHIVDAKLADSVNNLGPDNKPPPGVFEPVTAIDGVLTYASMSFENNHTFLGQLGVAFNCAIANSNEGTCASLSASYQAHPLISAPPGFAAKYVVWPDQDNQMGMQNTVASDLGAFYNDQSVWQTSQNGTTTVSISGASFNIAAYSPALGGQKDGVYRYAIDIWRN